MPVPYHSTANRPEWDELPEVVVAAIELRLGSPVRWWTVCGGGFTRGFAAVLRLRDGRDVFVKAAEDRHTPIAWESYRQEAKVLAWLPPGVPAPRLLWTLDERLAGDHWSVLGIEAVEGTLPNLPWTDDDLARVVAVVEEAAARLADPPPGLELAGLGPQLAVDEGAVELWPGVAAGSVEVEDAWARTHALDLGRLAARAPEAIAGDAAVHGDLRADNLLLGPTRSWICDWNRVFRAAAWTDLARVLVQAGQSGLDADKAWRASPLSAGGADDALDAWLAHLPAGHLTRAAGPEGPSASPWLRPHLRDYAAACLRWMEARRGA